MNKIKKYALGASTAISGFVLSTAPVLALDIGTVNDNPQGYASNIGQLVSGLLNVVMLIAAILVFIYLIWGGIEWITSGGDKSKTEGARNKITSAIIGLIVLAASYALLQLSLQLLGFGGINDLFQNVKPITES